MPRENNSLQPIDGDTENLTCEQAISQGYVRDKVDYAPLAYKDG